MSERSLQNTTICVLSLQRKVFLGGISFLKKIDSQRTPTTKDQVFLSHAMPMRSERSTKIRFGSTAFALSIPPTVAKKKKPTNLSFSKSNRLLDGCKSFDVACFPQSLTYRV